ncbi:cyclic nucleotide-binding domain-containing protein [Paracoccus sp. S-4012]|uniref:Crp/Fnr family transcriptional regulator n=1 Tax=Paracoccus sp. S-4012 TaxID=2665648 RepID=UPI0012AEFE6A|nr:Crp/Fnr family transcriptional regulator [Paracoccus sp. S-4012]MRX50470.1 cyclic nucleotide-binding domain-containing protein [Paracoccus sp. S-4012]
MDPAIDAIVRRAAILETAPPALQDQVLAEASVRRIAAGSTIFLQGEPAQAVFILAEGWVKLYRVTPSGNEAVVSVLTRGRSFGEAVALRELPYPLSAEAITDATLVRIDAARLRQKMQENPQIAIALLSATYVHLQHLLNQVEQLKARSGLQRVAMFLADLARCEDGACEVTLPYNKALIAGRLGMKPESLSRAFARLREHGVQIDSNTARIESLEALRDLASDDPGKAWSR